MNRISQFYLVSLLSIQLIVGPVLAHGGPKNADMPSPDHSTLNTNVSDRAAEEIASLMARGTAEGRKDPRVQAYQEDYELALHGLRTGDFGSLPVDQVDGFHLRGNRLEVLDPETGKVVETHDISGRNRKLPSIVATALSLESNPKTKELYIYALSNGNKVARHVIADLDVVAITHDNEIAQFIDSRGALHAIDMGFVAKQAFKTAIPIYQNLWAPSSDASSENEGNQDLRVRLISDATQEISPKVLAALEKTGDVLPRNGEGKPLVDFGDLYVYRETSKGEVPVGIFSRDVTYTQIIDRTQAFTQLLYLAAPEKFKPGYLSKLLQTIADNPMARLEFERQRKTTDGSVEDALQALTPESVVDLFKRGIGIEGSTISDTHSPDLEGLKARPFEQATLGEWARLHREIEDKASHQIRDLEERHRKSQEELGIVRKLIQKISNPSEFTADDLTRLQNLNEMQRNSDYTPSLDGLRDYDIAKAEKIKRRSILKSKLSSIKALWNDEALQEIRRLSKLFAISGVAFGGVTAYQFVSQNTLAIGEASIASLLAFGAWLYTNYVPDVAKDANYKRPLLLHSLSMMAAIPAAFFAGVATPWAMKATAGGVGFSALVAKKAKLPNAAKVLERYSNILVDRSKQWAEMGSWNRIVTMGNRGYSYIMYPFYNWFFGVTLQNPGFLESIANGINPFKIVTPNSIVGKEAGLKRMTFAGLTRPSLHPLKGPLRSIGIREGLIKPSETQAKRWEIQSRVREVIAAHESRARGLASLLATLEVSGQTGLDPATLLSVGQGLVKVDDLEKISDDKRKLAHWETMANAIYKELRQLEKTRRQRIFAKRLSEIDPQVFKDYYDAAQRAAKKIRDQGPVASAITQIRLKFRKGLKRFTRAVVNYGKADFEKLQNLHANNFVSTQNLSEFAVDHAIVVGLYGVDGPRADLSRPAELAADPNGVLWTSAPHMSDMAENTNAHLLKSGSGLVLVYQGEAKVSEKRYAPLSHAEIHESGTQENWLAGLGQWSFNLLRLSEMDFGGYFARDMLKRLMVVQAGLIFTVFFRATLGGQTPLDAIAAWAFYWNAAMWHYGFPWPIMRRGNHYESTRIATRNAPLRAAQKEIAKGLKLKKPELVESGYEALTKLYVKRSKEKNGVRHLRRLIRSIKDAEAKLSIRQKISKEVAREIRTSPRAFEYYASMTRLALTLETEEVVEPVELIKDGRLLEKPESEAEAFLVQKAKEEGRDLTIHRKRELLEHEKEELVDRAYRDLLQRFRGTLKAEAVEELKGLEANALLEYSMKYSPFPTQKNPWVSTITASFLGAVLTTALSRTLSVESFREENLTIENILIWAGINTAATLAIYTGFKKGTIQWVNGKAKAVWKSTLGRLLSSRAAKCEADL